MYYFIINPQSCSGNGMKKWMEMKAYLDEQQIEYQFKLTEFAGHAHKLAAMFTEEFAVKTIIILGGDGTLNEVINGLTHTENITLGYIPTGSSNDFARSQGIHRNSLEALKHLLESPFYNYLDLGEVTTHDQVRRFIVSSGIGFDASVCKEAMSSPIKDFLNRIHFGKLTYFATAIKQLIKAPTTTGQIQIDTSEYPLKRLLFAAAHNERFEGGGFLFCPDALPDDRKLDHIYVDDINKIKVLFSLPKAQKGKHTSIPEIHIGQCEHFSLSLNRELPVHTDGEYIGDYSHVSFSLAEAKIRIVQ